MIRGDARLLPGLLPEGTAGRAALVVTSPPYGPSVHGQVVAEQRRGTEGGVRKYDNRYGHDPANLASQGLDELLAGFTEILSGCAVLLRPGGLAVVTARPWRQHGELVDLPAAVIAVGARAGLVPVARCVALLAGLRGGKLIARPSFFQLDNLRRARAKGQPWHLIVHEDVLIFRNPPFPGSPAAGAQPAHAAHQRDARVLIADTVRDFPPSGITGMARCCPQDGSPSCRTGRPAGPAPGDGRRVRTVPRMHAAGGPGRTPPAAISAPLPAARRARTRPRWRPCAGPDLTRRAESGVDAAGPGRKASRTSRSARKRPSSPGEPARSRAVGRRPGTSAVPAPLDPPSGRSPARRGGKRGDTGMLPPSSFRRGQGGVRCGGVTYVRFERKGLAVSAG